MEELRPKPPDHLVQARKPPSLDASRPVVLVVSWGRQGVACVSGSRAVGQVGMFIPGPAHSAPCLGVHSEGPTPTVSAGPPHPVPLRAWAQLQGHRMEGRTYHQRGPWAWGPCLQGECPHAQLCRGGRGHLRVGARLGLVPSGPSRRGLRPLLRRAPRPPVESSSPQPAPPRRPVSFLVALTTTCQGLAWKVHP